MTEPEIDTLARQALEAFPPGPDGDLGLASDMAMRLMFKAARRGLKTAEIDRLRGAMEAALQALATTAETARPPDEAAAPSPAPQRAIVTPEHLQWIVDEAFSAPTDGSAGRARVLADRARGGVERAIADARPGWLAARRLRRRAETLIAARMREIAPRAT